MAIFFAQNRGYVDVLDEPGGEIGSMISVPDWGGFVQFKSIFTNITIAEQANYQFLHTLGDHIYIYIFGDRIGQVGLSGVSFFDNCDLAAGNTKTGIAHVIDFYRKHRITVRPEHTLITIQPDDVLECFLLGMRGQVLDPAQKMFQFHLSLALIPPDAEK